MNELIEIDCQNNFIPPRAAITIAGVFIGAFPIGDYNKLKPVLGLPDFPCTKTTEG